MNAYGFLIATYAAINVAALAAMLPRYCAWANTRDRKATPMTTTEAVQFTGDIWPILRFTGGSGSGGDGKLHIHRLAISPDLTVEPGDWVVRDGDTFTVCDSATFADLAGESLWGRAVGRLPRPR